MTELASVIGLLRSGCPSGRFYPRSNLYLYLVVR
jgi:hypothetical protein